METAEIRYTDYAESWYRVWCPYCESENWFCNGNEQDISGVDVEAVRCRGCKKLFRLGVYDSILEEIRGKNGTVYEEDGCKMVKVNP